MKMKSSVAKSLLALAAAALIASSAKAQVTYVQGDFLLGFRASGGTGGGSNVLVDIGSTFLTSNVPVTFSLGDLQTKLVNTYGGSWNTRSDVFFSVAGATQTGDASNTVYVTAPEVIGSGEATPWNSLGSSAQQGIRSKINTEGGIPNTAGYNFYAQTAGNPAVIEGQTDTNSYGSYHPGGTVTNSGPAPGISYAQFNPTIEGAFANGTGGITLDLIKLVPNTGAGIDLGDFTISNSGVLTWTPNSFEAVPEPSTLASIATGAGLLLLAIRRRKSANI